MWSLRRQMSPDTRAPGVVKPGVFFKKKIICFFDRTAQTAANEETGSQHHHQQQPHPRRVHAHPTCPRSHIPRSHEVTFTVDEVAPWNTGLHSRRSEGRDSVGTFTLTALWCSSPFCSQPAVWTNRSPQSDRLQTGQK